MLIYGMRQPCAVPDCQSPRSSRASASSTSSSALAKWRDHDDGAQAGANQTISADANTKVLTRNKTLRCATSAHDAKRFAIDVAAPRR